MEKRVTVLNCPIDICDMQEAIDLSICAIRENKNFHVITVNPEMVMNAQKNEAFFNILNSSDLNIADGIGVRVALKLQGISQVQLRGIDFSRELIKLASEEKLKIGFIGATEEVIQKAKDNILKEYPDLEIVYLRNGYFSNDDMIIDEIKEASPSILLVGLGSPRQEEFIVKLKNKINNCIMVGVGGSFDVFSGNVQEAPKIYQKLGIEWLYRTILQPERFKRIFPTLPLFLIKCIIAIISKKG